MGDPEREVNETFEERVLTIIATGSPKNGDYGTFEDLIESIKEGEKSEEPVYIKD